MNKYTLAFKDAQIEQKYQRQLLKVRRWTTFCFVTFGISIIFIIKCVQAGVEGNNYQLLSSAVLLSYFLIQLLFVKFYPQYIRLALILVNHIMNIYLFAQETKKDPQMAMLQGINQMGATYLLVLIGEYLDGIITLVNLSVFRIVWAIAYSTQIQMSAIVSSILLIFYINYFNYQFHKGMRSQFLLSFVDSNFEELLKKLSFEFPYMIIQFQQDNLSCHISSSNKCESLFLDTQESNDFMNNSYVDSIPLKSFLFQLIQKYNQDHSANSNNEFIIKYQKKSFLITSTLFQTNSLKALLSFKEFNKVNFLQKHLLINRNLQLMKIIIKLAKRLKYYSNSNYQYLKIQRKALILILNENINLYENYKEIQVLSLIKKLLNYCSNLDVKVFTNIKLNQTIITHTKLFALIFWIIMDNVKSNQLILSCYQTEQFNYQIKFNSQFDLDKIQNLIYSNLLKYQILFLDIFLSKTEIILVHTCELDVPFFLDSK
ncbi:unnamed protein product [Paramecium primaurelia]|uniref:Transmembrane protein n=1 Tax=Paramecium primaurelia TaxID=5886 RepID=A0A8S1MP34_PARPR|nr:unnamed protein product [Paramecium primaurelia]